MKSIQVGERMGESDGRGRMHVLSPAASRGALLHQLVDKCISRARDPTSSVGGLRGGYQGVPGASPSITRCVSSTARRVVSPTRRPFAEELQLWPRSAAGRVTLRFIVDNRFDGTF